MAKELSVNKNKLCDDCGPGDIQKWDSVTHFQILLSLEKEFHIAFSVDDVLDIETLGDIIEVVDKHIN